MISFLRFQVFFLLIPMFVGCGSEHDTESAVFAGEHESGLTVFVGRQDGTRRLLMVSSPGEASAAEVCLVINGQCSPIAMSKSSPSASRSIFSTDTVPVTVGTRLRFTVRDSSGQERVRELSIAVAGGAPATPNFNWKAVMMAGDYQDDGQKVVAWDNARRDLTRLLVGRGFSAQNFRQLSRDPEVLRTEQQVQTANAQGLDAAFASLSLQGDDRCFLFMTSHGSQSEFYIEGDRGISPTAFGQILDRHCGQRPTVAVVSACYSGIMINQNTQRNNRIIFTAASATRTSNGCQPGVQYTFFDECLVQGLQNNSVQTFDDLARSTKACIDGKENASNASFPQFFIGDSMKNLAISNAAPANQPNGNASGLNAQNPSTPSNPSGLPGILPSQPGNTNPDGAPAPGNNSISSEKNLRLVGPSGPTDLKTVAGSARYLLIDFSQPSCPYCVQFARTIEQQSELFASGTCKAITLVGRNQLGAWVRAAEAGGATTAGTHSYSLADLSHGAAKGKLDGTNTSGPVPTPTILVFDTQTNQLAAPESSGALSASALQRLLGQNCR